MSPVITTSEGSTASKLDARALKTDTRAKGHKDDAMEVEQPLICNPVIATLAELCDYDSEDDFSEAAPSRCPTPCTPPPQPEADTNETNPPTVHRVGGPTIEEQQESDRAYIESEPIRTSPPRPLKRQARVYYAATSSSAMVKKPSEEKFDAVNFELREKKRALTVDSDDEDLTIQSNTTVVDATDGHRNKRVRFEAEEPKTRRNHRGRRKHQ